jgi:hypothetical protein
MTATEKGLEFSNAGRRMPGTARLVSGRRRKIAAFSAPIAMMAPMKPGRLVTAALALAAVACGHQPGFAQSSSTGQSSTVPDSSVPAAKSAAAVTVPFVGCASDGQAGPVAAPSGKSVTVAIPPAMAQRLAYYKAEYSAGALAPRGWNCFSTYGSNGASLFVSPDPTDSKTLLSLDWKGFTGPAVQISVDDGGTSGRFEVAEIIARVFPAYKAFAQKVIAEGIEPASDFPFGPFPSDKLTHRSKSVVEFETPANAQGLGTDSRLQMNASPIDGVAIISGADTDLTLLSARVPETDGDLIPAMVAQVESEAAATASN